MPSLISSGIGSGLDIQGIVQQLVAAEGQPVESRIGLKEARAQAKLSAYGSLKSALAGMRDNLEAMKSLDKILIRKAVSGNEDFFSATADGKAVPAAYSLEVVQLAQAQKLTSGAFVDSDSVIGTGTLRIATGTAIAALEITSENNTLAGIRDAINSAPNNPGVAATIVNADSGSYLIMTSNSTGAVEQMTITQSGGDGGLSAIEFDPGAGLNSMTESIPAQDALIRIDGLDVMSNTNTFAGAVQGVTISVVQESPGSISGLTVENDVEAVRGVVDEFVDSYNALVDTFDGLTSYNAETDQAAPLLGDSAIRGIRDQIRRELSTPLTDADSPFSLLRDVGIELQLDGKLTVKDDELSVVLAEDFVNFGQLFSNTDGFATRLFDLSEGFLSGGGIIETRSNGLTTTIEGFADQREALNERLVSLESRLFRQFNALDSLLEQLSQTSNFLSQQLGNLPGYTRPNQ